MQKKIRNISFFLFGILIIILSVWGPERLANYKDRMILNEAHTKEIEETGEGYSYILSSNEKLYILSECLNSQALPESDLNALTRNTAAGVDYQELVGTYAFVVNRKGISEKEITGEEIYEICNSELELLKELGILPDTVKGVEEAAYDVVLYSAIDVLEPRNNVSVWKISLSNSQKNFVKENRLMDAYVDADNGKIYEFYARTELTWGEIDTDKIIEIWSEYMGLTNPAPYETENPLLETTPYFKKYVFTGVGGGKTIVTVGFYEGIKEIFLKISK